MRLSTFIRSDMPAILAAWTAFAKKAAPETGKMSDLALTDHAQAILIAVALDMETRQSQQQQFEKSQVDEVAIDVDSAAAIHGRLRHASNFSLLQLSSEFRALRATVLRLWLPRVQQMTAATVDDMVRFNEAIDQALAESIVTYSLRSERTRDLFLAVLGHDLRGPLATISLAADLLARPGVDAGQVATLAHRAKRSAKLMGAMVTDLLGYTRVQLGAGMPTNCAMTDVQPVCQAAMTDARAMYPHSSITYQASGNVTGWFDAIRLQQLVTNLLINAAQHSDKGKPVTLTLAGSSEAITISVANAGPVIPAESLETIFQPLVQLEPDIDEEGPSKTSLGLGLFIVHETAVAHGGTIAVTSTATDGTVFTATFPRRASS